MENPISQLQASQQTDNQLGNFRQVLNQSLRVFFKDWVQVSLTNPSQAYFFFKTFRWQKKAAATRQGWQEQGIPVPPIMIYSITSRCNLHCKGCYHQTLRPAAQEELSAEKVRGIIAEARELGISFGVLAGGEPLVRPEILDITADFPDIIFLMFTNGLLIDRKFLSRLKKPKNLVPVLSLEGYEKLTDERRGSGVYERLQQSVDLLKKNSIFWSVSLTITRENFETVTGGQFVEKLAKQGCKLFFFVEYTPVKEGTEDWLITPEQRAELIRRRDAFRRKHPALFIAVPGDEDEIGGCISAGKGFIHISSDGNVEPCPFAPYSDTNLRNTSLKEALKSPFLRAIRDNHDRLTETEGGCALWVKREWVRSLLSRDSSKR